MKTDFAALSKLGIPESLARQILADGVRAILLLDGLPGPGITLGEHRRLLSVIRLNCAIDCKVAAQELRKKIRIDLEPGEVFLWVVLHEYGHFKGHKSEVAADAFASDRLAKLRGYSRRHTISLHLDIAKTVAEAFRQAKTEFHGPPSPGRRE